MNIYSYHMFLVPKDNDLLLEGSEVILFLPLLLHFKDAAEIDQLISYLINKEDSEGVVLVGHSTGCQVIA